MEFDRRSILQGGAAGFVAAVAALCSSRRSEAAPGKFEVAFTDSEWHQRLSPEQYASLRQGATERPGSSPLDHEKRKGVYHCAGCDLDLYPSAAKFDSGTGWPSFTKPLPHAVVTRDDYSLSVRRTEVLCRRCGSHLGHVFEDGPPPTGQRYCMNGLALRFVPA